ncbi:hypothetical protein [Inquilinus sp.]|jgi:hypothetical protein|uniref:hypothetical protein n=1 Tax=Inquilinus sp. TaxID=1932117 RepID=UPI0037836360
MTRRICVILVAGVLACPVAAAPRSDGPDRAACETQVDVAAAFEIESLRRRIAALEERVETMETKVSATTQFPTQENVQ